MCTLVSFELQTLNSDSLNARAEFVIFEDSGKSNLFSDCIRNKFSATESSRNILGMGAAYKKSWINSIAALSGSGQTLVQNKRRLR